MDTTASFGYWLRRRRKAVDLTQAELAQRVGCAENTIRKIEADERRPSKQLAALLADLLALDGAERAAFLQAARAELSADRLAMATAPLDQPAVALPTGTVTFLFTDIEGSTRLWEQHPQAMPDALAQHDVILRAAIEGHGGVVFRTEGDAFCAAFARASDALAAALAAQRALHTAAWGATGPLQVRMALHTGVVAVGGDDYQGLALSRVARLLAAGHGGQVLLSHATAELVREHLPPDVTLRALGEHRLKDLTHPEHIAQLIAPDLPAAFPPLKTLTVQRTNLPVQPTPLIGRVQDMAAVLDRVRRADVRLLTLSGPGGVGKTRLALQSAAELLDGFADGVWFVNLAPISDPALVASAIAQTLGVTETGGQLLLDSLKAYLRDKQQLLLLDNFEQVVDAAPLVAELLTSAPGLTVLVTSRAVLHLTGEHEFGVLPLSLPDPTHVPPPEGLTQYDAVRLFIDRAQAVKRDFTVTNANAPAVAEICARLDGLPLAIELAAARLKLFAPAALLKRLEQRLPLLTGGARDLPARQQTLRAAIDWSYHLLDAAEQTLFRRLAMFVGGCSLDAAEAVCNVEHGLESGVLDGLAALVDQSLLRQVEGPDGESCFVMLETIREYALERLELSGEAEVLRQRHAAYYLALAEGAEPRLHGADQLAWLDRLEAEHDNLHAALAWSLTDTETRRHRDTEQTGETVSLSPDPPVSLSRSELGLRLAAALWWFWNLRGSLSEGRAWLERALAESTDASAPLRAMALVRAGWLAAEQGDTPRALCEESLALFRTLDDQQGIGWALTLLAGDVYHQGDQAQGIALCEEALALFHTLDDPQGIAWALYFLGNLVRVQGDYRRASALLEESLALHRERGDMCRIGYTVEKLGLVAWAQGDYERAGALLAESLAVWQELGNRRGSAITIERLGLVAWAQGDYERAGALLAESLMLWRELGDKLGIATSLNKLGELARGQGDDQRAAALYQESLALRRELDDRSGSAVLLHNLGYVALHQGDGTRAAARFAESLALYQERGNQHGIALCLAGLAGVARVQEQAERAARLFGAAEALLDAVGAQLDPTDRMERDRYMAATRTQLDAATFAVAWVAGRAMTLEQAIAYALGEDIDPPMADRR